MTIKAIAYYLPQFHEIPENNEWWGQGFTEWVNLKKAEPLYPGHTIPKPLNNNYYNLLDKQTVIWQTELAKRYKIYGFNYYHYWFMGKKILEKPAENFLKWKEIDHNFMFMWANHDWTRSWVGGKEILIKQEYGDEEDWVEHINYLIPFFQDERYIKLSNKPVFEVYLRKNIEEFEKMVQVWDRECINNGFDGIYIIDHHEYIDYETKNISDICEAVTYEQHSCALGHGARNKSFLSKLKTRLKASFFKLKNNTNVRFIDYSYVVENAIDFMNEIEIDKSVVFQVSTGWDNTPRYGERGYIVGNSTPEEFKHFLKEAVSIGKRKKSKFLFLACWNEWCEGLVLEPTDKDGYAFLKAIKDVLEDYSI